MSKVLYIDIGLCTECKGCVEISPDIFRYNNETGYMEVIQSDQYNEELVEEAMKNCPEKCIRWEGEDSKSSQNTKRTFSNEEVLV